MIDKNLLHQLSDDLSSAMTDLYEFKIIYNVDQMDLLNRTAPFFFLKLRDYYWNRLILAISRFTDPIKSNGFENLSIKVLTEFAKDLPEPLEQKIVKNIENVVKASGKIREYRNKIISHRDMNTAILTDDDLPIIYVETVEYIFSSIDDSLNIFYHHLENTHEEHCPTLITHGAQSLLYYLSLGNEIEEQMDSANE
ncbi:MAG: hypothetical protein NTZ48_07710 [Candidatus Omnitrophica bacterium]|nr:hypothetical protein [Candidatus Omnitrophota bacterium]